jgi:MtN3 and saliva related transmembrane protein
MNLDLLGFTAATLTTVAFVPQAVQTIRSRDTRAISLWMYLTFTAGIALCVAYGVALNSRPIILSNTSRFSLPRRFRPSRFVTARIRPRDAARVNRL